MADSSAVQTATVSSDKTLKIYDFNSNKIIFNQTETSPLISLDRCQWDSNYLIYGAEHGYFVLKDLRNFNADLRREHLGPNIQVRKVGFSFHKQTASRMIAVGAHSLFYYKVASCLPVQRRHR